MQVMSLLVTATSRLIYCLSHIVEGKTYVLAFDLYSLQSCILRYHEVILFFLVGKWKISRVSRELRLATERNTCQVRLPKVKVRFLDENKYYLKISMLMSLQLCILNLFFLNRATNIYTSEAA